MYNLDNSHFSLDQSKITDAPRLPPLAQGTSLYADAYPYPPRYSGTHDTRTVQLPLASRYPPLYPSYSQYPYDPCHSQLQPSHYDYTQPSDPRHPPHYPRYSQYPDDPRYYQPQPSHYDYAQPYRFPPWMDFSIRERSPTVPPPPSGLSFTRPKRRRATKRATIVCRQCRRLKIKCSGCPTGCASYGPRDSPEGYISALEERLRKIEASVHKPKRDKAVRPIESLNPTLSSWLDNMTRLSALVDKVHALAQAAPAEHRKPILARVAELRAAYKKQQERCIEFLQLTQEYADRYLADISDEVRAQGALLRALEQRLKTAKDLRAEVVSLQSAFEKGTCAGLKTVRKSVMAASLPDDVKLFKELDTILKTIQTCYKDLDKFWIGEVRRVTKALKSRRMEKEDGDRWNGIEAALQEAIDIAKEDGSALRAASPARPPDPCTPNLGQICIGTVAADMGPAMAVAGTALRALYRSMPPSPHEARLLHADLHLRRTRDAYLALLQRCASYGRSVVSGRASLALRPAFPRVKDMQDRRAGLVPAALPLPLSKASDDDGRVARYCGCARAVRESAALLRKTERAWDALCKRRNTVFARVLAPDDPDAYIHAGACSARQLSRALRAWAKEGEVLRVAAARLGTRPQTILTAVNFL